MVYTEYVYSFIWKLTEQLAKFDVIIAILSLHMLGGFTENS